MKRLISVRSRTAVASLLVSLCACNRRLAVVDSIDARNTTTSSDDGSKAPDAGEDSRLPRAYLNTGCQCASSDALQPLLCNGGVLPLAANDYVETTRDGRVVAFEIGKPGTPNSFFGNAIAYWDGSHTEAVSDGSLLGLSAAGKRLLFAATDQPGLTVLDRESGDSVTLFALGVIGGHGSLSASGDWVIGETLTDPVQLARASANTGQVELLGDVGSLISTALTTPDASTVVGFIQGPTDRSAASQAFRWRSEGGLSFSLPGVPPDIVIVPEAINESGTVIAGQSLTQQSWFRWSEVDGYESIGSDSSASLISDDGSVVAGALIPPGAFIPRDPKGSGIFRWTRESGVVVLTPDQPSTAVGMSGDGSVIVALGVPATQSALDAAGPTYIWDATHGTRTLDVVLSDRGIDTDGWSFSEARVLSRDGKVLLGRGYCGDVPTLYRLVLSD